MKFHYDYFFFFFFFLSGACVRAEAATDLTFLGVFGLLNNLDAVKELEVEMEKFKEMLKELQELDIIQNSGSWEDHIPKKLWDDYFAESEFKEVKWNIDVDTHRWYETSITVIKIFGGLLGICYITNLFSESSDHEDCFHKIRFYEMEEIQTISYKRKD